MIKKGRRTGTHHEEFPGLFFSPALIFDGLGLIVLGVGGRLIVSMVSDQGVTGELPDTPIGEDENRSKG
ncbi:hypothetical protein [Streptomyces sp. NPDC018000]|uniref:hypothetical protein n=1 Tax=Streptomyces sp. NPDC018000 TaxID=3365028 RepID=UPI00378C248A